MLDFSKIFNIVFVSVCAALLLLLLISVIVVAAKGKRKCGAGDVLLRILSTLVLIASAAMLACSILTMLNTVDGSMCIVAVQEGNVTTAYLAMGGEITKLPFPELFVALSTVIGFGLAAVLFILSLTALIVDCLVANKKDGKKDKNKKKEPAVKKSPEQLKREAELERIRCIGESAVRKTERVAEKAEKTEKTEKPQNEVGDTQSAPEQTEDEQEPAVDWRSQPAEEKHSFVGLKDEGDDSFDSFDTFDDEQPADVGAEDYEQAENEPAEEAVEEAAEQSDEYDAENGEYAEEQSDEYTEEVTDEYAAENGDEYAEEYAEQQATDEQPVEDIYYDEDEQYTYDDGAQAEEGYEQAEDELVDGEDNYDYAQTDEQPIDEYEQADEQPADEFDEGVSEQPTDEYEQASSEQPVDIAEEVERILETPTDDIEPDRGIYIPEIRTVTPRATETTAAAQKPTAQKSPVKKPPSKATRPIKPKKSGSTGASQRPAGVGGKIPPEKKLPVTRRYVILDRHNAVNMFGEYLKERNQAEKDKLKSSINTIIIE